MCPPRWDGWRYRSEREKNDFRICTVFFSLLPGIRLKASKKLSRKRCFIHFQKAALKQTSPQRLNSVAWTNAWGILSFSIVKRGTTFLLGLVSEVIDCFSSSALIFLRRCGAEERNSALSLYLSHSRSVFSRNSRQLIIRSFTNEKQFHDFFRLSRDRTFDTQMKMHFVRRSLDAPTFQFRNFCHAEDDA